ncbi:MAG: hypothetical protein U0350_49250 [Caldilineaceae bacterium]
MVASRQILLDQLQANVPEALRQLNQWVVWRMEKRNDKPTKVPYAAQTGEKAKATEPATWSSFTNACQAYQTGQYTGLGFVFSDHDPYVGVDFDHCIEHGTIKESVWHAIHQLDSYTEYSQSGTGLHVIVQGTLPASGRKSVQRGIEVYATARFFVMTGNHLPNTPRTIAAAQTALTTLYQDVFGATPLNSDAALPLAEAHQSNDDQALLARMFASEYGVQIQALWRGDITAYHGDHSAADLALCNYLAFWTNSDAQRMDQLFRQSRLMRDKWDRKARQGETYGQGTINRAIAGVSKNGVPPQPTQPRPATGNSVVAAATQQIAEQTNALPTIVVNQRQLPAITADALAALVARNRNQPTQPLVYVRGGLLTRVVQDENGEHFTQPLTEPAARSVLARAAQWVKLKESTTGYAVAQSVFPPSAVVRDLLCLTNWPDLPKLTGLVHCPTFAPSGHLHANYGYDPATQLFNACHLRLDAVQLTQANLQSAKKLLLQELLVDFPFDSQASRAHAVSLLLLPFVRPLIDGPTPIHAIDAPTPGTGKGLLANACSYAARGRDLASTPAAQDDAEWRKRLTAAFLRGDTHILIDNINQPLQSASLAAALTQQVWADRLLGQTLTLSLPINQIWIATGNNLVSSDEIARRCIRIRLDANVERPDQRQGFKHTNLMRWVRQQRLPLLTAALTLIQYWVQAGMPRFTNQRKGSYETWGEVVGGILQAASIDGFLQNEHDLYEAATTETSRLVEFVETWYRRYGEQEVQVKELFKLASRPDGSIPPAEQGQWCSLLEDALGSGNELSRRAKLGRLLDENKDKIIAGYKLLKNVRDKKRPRFALHCLVTAAPVVVRVPNLNGAAKAIS